jgi:hypothetical protein
MQTIAIVKNRRKVYANRYIDPLLINAIIGLDEIARAVYGDELVYFEMGGYSINCLKTVDGSLIISHSREKRMEDLRCIYEAYSTCVLYDDMSLMNVLLNEGRRQHL